MGGVVDIPIFYGDDPEGWVSWVEAYGSDQGFSDGERVQFAYGFVEGDALTWFLEENTKSPFDSWIELKQCILRRFGKGKKTYDAVQKIFHEEGLESFNTESHETQPDQKVSVQNDSDLVFLAPPVLETRTEPLPRKDFFVSVSSLGNLFQAGETCEQKQTDVEMGKNASQVLDRMTKRKRRKKRHKGISHRWKAKRKRCERAYQMFGNMSRSRNQAAMKQKKYRQAKRSKYRSRNSELDHKLKSLEKLNYEYGSVAAMANQKNLELENVRRSSRRTAEEAKSHIKELKTQLTTAEQKNVELEQQVSSLKKKCRDTCSRGHLGQVDELQSKSVNMNPMELKIQKTSKSRKQDTRTLTPCKSVNYWNTFQVFGNRSLLRFAKKEIWCLRQRHNKRNRKKLAAKRNRVTCREIVKRAVKGQSMGRMEGFNSMQCRYNVIIELLLWEIQVKKKPRPPLYLENLIWDFKEWDKGCKEIVVPRISKNKKLEKRNCDQVAAFAERRRKQVQRTRSRFEREITLMMDKNYHFFYKKWLLRVRKGKKKKRKKKKELLMASLRGVTSKRTIYINWKKRNWFTNIYMERNVVMLCYINKVEFKEWVMAVPMMKKEPVETTKFKFGEEDIMEGKHNTYLLIKLIWLLRVKHRKIKSQRQKKCVELKMWRWERLGKLGNVTRKGNISLCPNRGLEKGMVHPYSEKEARLVKELILMAYFRRECALFIGKRIIDVAETMTAMHNPETMLLKAQEVWLTLVGFLDKQGTSLEMSVCIKRLSLAHEQPMKLQKNTLLNSFQTHQKWEGGDDLGIFGRSASKLLHRLRCEPKDAIARYILNLEAIILQVVLEVVLTKRTDPKTALEELLSKWKDLPALTCSREVAAAFKKQFPNHNLEDKVVFVGAGIDRDAATHPPVLYHYARRRKPSG